MNILLQDKKVLETSIKNNSDADQRLRLLTGYDELTDSIVINPVYNHPELVDSIYYLKTEKEWLKSELKNINYSIDSLSKLK